jgi:EPS-associated MarR family transcriptional regulator
MCSTLNTYSDATELASGLPRPISRNVVPAEETRFRVLRLVESQPELTQREIARELGVSLGGVSYCIRALADKGLVKVRNFRNSSNKAAYAYILTPAGIAEKTILTGRFLARKMNEYEQLKSEIALLERELHSGSADGTRADE